jgi:hypothetical protein
MSTLQQKLGIDYDGLQQWIFENAPSGWTLEDAKAMLELLGYMYLMILQDKNPEYDLAKMSVLLFGQGEEKRQVEKLLGLSPG